MNKILTPLLVCVYSNCPTLCFLSFKETKLSLTFLFLQMPPLSLKEIATMVMIVQIRTMLFAYMNIVDIGPVLFFTNPGREKYNRNLAILRHLITSLNDSRNKMNKEWHDVKRWRSILSRNISETEHYLLLLDTSLTEHFSLFHLFDQDCQCWAGLVHDLRGEFGYLRRRLF